MRAMKKLLTPAAAGATGTCPGHRHRPLPYRLLVLLLAGGTGLALAGPAPAASDIDFAPCELKAPDAFTGPEGECATVTVPVNHAEPDGASIQLRLARIPARAATPLPDPIVFLAGGPGQSAVESWSQIAGAYHQLLADRQVYLLDQRGTGGSHPLRCQLPDPLDPTAGSPDAGQLRQQASDCLAGIDVDVRHFGTRDYLADLELVRERLGVAQWNLVGGSYGTRVALSYVQAHPQALRSVVLDGVVPQQVALGQDHGPNLETALAAQFARCHADAACAETFNDLDQTLAALRQRYRQVPTTVLVRDPRSHRALEVPLNHDTLAGVVRLYAYAPETAALLPLLLNQALEGDPRPLLAQAVMLYSQIDEIISHGMQLSVICGEDHPWLEPDAGADTLIGADLVELMAAQCAVWPHRRAPEEFKQPVDSDLPMLLLSGEFDPVTPPAYAERALATLGNARHLVAPGQGHIVQARGCLPRLMTTFIRDAGFENLDSQCLEKMSPPPFFLDFNGGQP